MLRLREEHPVWVKDGVPKMDRDRCRTVLVQGIDKILSFRMFGPTEEQRAVLLAARQVAIADDVFIEKIAHSVGPYHEGENMPKKTMTVADIQAIDWAALVAKLPALAALIAQIYELLMTQQRTKAVKASGPCPVECHELSHRCLATLAEHVVAQLDLHDCIGCCDE